MRLEPTTQGVLNLENFSNFTKRVPNFELQLLANYKSYASHFGTSELVTK